MAAEWRRPCGPRSGAPGTCGEPLVDHPPDRARVEPAAPRAEEQGGPAVRGRAARGRPSASQRVDGAQRPARRPAPSLLGALAQHPEQPPAASRRRRRRARTARRPGCRWRRAPRGPPRRGAPIGLAVVGGQRRPRAAARRPRPGAAPSGSVRPARAWRAARRGRSPRSPSRAAQAVKYARRRPAGPASRARSRRLLRAASQLRSTGRSSSARVVACPSGARARAGRATSPAYARTVWAEAALRAQVPREASSASAMAAGAPTSGRSAVGLPGGSAAGAPPYGAPCPTAHPAHGSARQRRWSSTAGLRRPRPAPSGRRPPAPPRAVPSHRRPGARPAPAARPAARGATAGPARRAASTSTAPAAAAPRAPAGVRRSARRAAGAGLAWRSRRHREPTEQLEHLARRRSPGRRPPAAARMAAGRRRGRDRPGHRHHRPVERPRRAGGASARRCARRPRPRPCRGSAPRCTRLRSRKRPAGRPGGRRHSLTTAARRRRCGRAGRRAPPGRRTSTPQASTATVGAVDGERPRDAPRRRCRRRRRTRPSSPASPSPAASRAGDVLAVGRAGPRPDDRHRPFDGVAQRARPPYPERRAASRSPRSSSAIGHSSSPGMTSRRAGPAGELRSRSTSAVEASPASREPRHLRAWSAFASALGRDPSQGSASSRRVSTRRGPRRPAPRRSLDQLDAVAGGSASRGSADPRPPLGARGARRLTPRPRVTAGRQSEGAGHVAGVGPVPPARSAHRPGDPQPPGRRRAAVRLRGRARRSAAPTTPRQPPPPAQHVTGHLGVQPPRCPPPAGAAVRARAPPPRAATTAVRSPRPGPASAAGSPAASRPAGRPGRAAARTAAEVAAAGPSACRCSRGPGRRARPHGHGLAASTSWNRAGNRAAAAARRDRDLAGLQRLAQGVEHRRRELRRLVEEQHPAVGERGRARPDVRRAAADDRGHRRRVVRRRNGGPRDQRPPPGEQRRPPSGPPSPRSPPSRVEVGQQRRAAARRASSCRRPAARP